MLQNKMLPLFVILGISINLISCSDCHFTIKPEYIKSTCAFTQGFSFQELNVYSFEDKMPDSVDVIRTIRASLIKDGLRPSKKIYFYQENKNYDWNDLDNGILLKTLPIKIKVGKWYRIRGLVFRGHPNRAAYIKLNEDGELEVYGYSESKCY